MWKILRLGAAATAAHTTPSNWLVLLRHDWTRCKRVISRAVITATYASHHILCTPPFGSFFWAWSYKIQRLVMWTLTQTIIHSHRCRQNLNVSLNVINCSIQITRRGRGRRTRFRIRVLYHIFSISWRWRRRSKRHINSFFYFIYSWSFSCERGKSRRREIRSNFFRI